MNRGRFAKPGVRHSVLALWLGLTAAPAVMLAEDAKQEPALGGYCPASYLLANEAKKGVPQHQSTYEGKLYYFADEAAKKAFDADPGHYLPAFNGLCTTALGGRYGNRMQSDPTIFSILDDKLYLFSSERARNAYGRAPQRYVDTAKERFEAFPVELRIPDPQFANMGTPTPATPQPAQQKPAYELIGQPVPPAVFTLPGGEVLSTPEMTDDATLIMFYATWCGFCKKALPYLEEISKELEGKSAKILAVSMDTLKETGATGPRQVSQQDVVSQFTSLGVTLPQAFDMRGDGKNKFKVQSFPTLFLLDKAGIVQRAYIGAAAVNDGSLKKAMEDLVAGKRLEPQEIPPPTTAQTPPARPVMSLQGQQASKGTFTSAGEGSPYSLAEPGADATVAFFYASWCGYCKKALPELDFMANGYQGRPVRFVGINQDTIIEQADPSQPRAKTKDEVVKQWTDMGIDFDQMLDPSGVGRNDFKVQSYPTMFLIGKDGKITKVYVGATSVSDGTLKKDIEAVLAGNPS